MQIHILNPDITFTTVNYDENENVESAEIIIHKSPLLYNISGPTMIKDIHHYYHLFNKIETKEPWYMRLTLENIHYYCNKVNCKHCRRKSNYSQRFIDSYFTVY